MNSPDGGPAFPIHPDMPCPPGQGIPPIGMTLLDYFAAHAPDEPTWIFDAWMPNDRPACEYDAECAWDREYTRQTAIQWPWVYAEAMLAEKQRRQST